MTTLERRCRLLLRAYPAEYRQDRGEEIMCTLLEATPEGRAWPPARDVRSLVMGGLQARAALNRQLTTAANLRIATLVGASAYLVHLVASELAFAVITRTARTGVAHRVDWPSLLVAALVLVAVVVAWLSGRRTAVLASAVAAGAALLLVTGLLHGLFAFSVPELACLVALALLAGGTERPARRWLLLVALAAAVPLSAYLVAGVWPLSFLALLEVIGVLSLLWAVIDARPAVAMAVFLLANLLPTGIFSLTAGPDIGSDVPLLIVIAAAAVAVWQLRRQSAHVTPDGTRR